jgi:uncharacterized membrane protein YedE/YeeE
MPLLLHGLPPIHWALAGAGIAGVTLTPMLLASRRLGISTGFEDICSLPLSQPFFRREAAIGGRTWRLPLLAALLAGGFLSAVTGVGGLLFAIGWSVCGMCPGPILVNIGEGKLYACGAVAGALAGAGLFGVLYPALQPPLRMPPLQVGPGEG